MKHLLIVSVISLLASCNLALRGLPTGSNIRTATVRTISHDTVRFYGSPRLYILKGQAAQQEKIQYTVLKLNTDTSLAVIKRL